VPVACYFTRLPSVSAELARRFDATGALLREFGAVPEDLDLDLDAADRPALVTDLLRNCSGDGEGRRFDTDLFWELPIGGRIHALVLLWQRSGRRRSALARCVNSGCDTLFEVEIPLGAFVAAAEATEAEDRIELTEGPAGRTLRRPRGTDLRVWSRHSSSELDMLRRLSLADAPEVENADQWERIETALAERDPLIDASVTGTCAGCGAAFKLELDLEAEALASLAEEQEALLDSIDRLASVYHWSEAEILALPPWRRRRYVSKIEGTDT
jgi:hypothetical protein